MNNTQQSSALPRIEQHLRFAMTQKSFQGVYNFLRRISHRTDHDGLALRPAQCSPITLSSFGMAIMMSMNDASMEDLGGKTAMDEHLRVVLAECTTFLKKYRNTPFDIFSDTGRFGMYAASHTSAFAASYLRDKRILYVQDALVEAIAPCAFPDNVPAKALQYLPFAAFAFQIDKTWYTAHYDYSYKFNELGDVLDYNTEDLQLVLCKLHENGILNLFATVVTGSEPLERSLHGQNKEEMRTILNCLLYIAGDNDVVERVGHTFVSAKKKERKQTSEVTDKRALQEPILIDAGVRFAAALQQFKQHEEQEEQGTSKGKSVTMRPHIRRAHPHLYWKNDTERVDENGKPVKIPIVRYLPPVAVKGGTGTDTVTIQQVK